MLAHLLLGVVFLAVGVVLGSSGIRRLAQGRTAEDMAWDRRHPIRRVLLDPVAVMVEAPGIAAARRTPSSAVSSSY